MWIQIGCGLDEKDLEWSTWYERVQDSTNGWRLAASSLTCLSRTGTTHHVSANLTRRSSRRCQDYFPEHLLQTGVIVLTWVSTVCDLQSAPSCRHRLSRLCGRWSRRQRLSLLLLAYNLVKLSTPTLPSQSNSDSSATPSPSSLLSYPSSGSTAPCLCFMERSGMRLERGRNVGCWRRR